MFDAIGAVTKPRLSILIFHRVHGQQDSMFPDEPDAARFDRLIHFVARSFRVMALRDAIRCMANDEMPSRAMVITFDDGYADNAAVALPVLLRHGVTATFFVSTGFLDGGRMWNDSVIECLRTTPKNELDLESFGLGPCALASLDQRRSAIGSLLPRIKYLGGAERQEAVSRLQRLCGVADLPTDLMMTSGQLRELFKSGMEIGAHTVNHPILKNLTPSQAEQEIQDGKHALEDIVQGPVDTFAYPNGRPGQDYDETHVSLVRRLGFCGAVSTSPGVSRSGDDLFQLPRFTPWGRSMAAWAARLAANQRRTEFARADSKRATN